jgi:hypothetical protein
VFSEEYFLLEENQFGFRKSYSTTDSIFTLFSFFEILKSIKKKLLVENFTANAVSVAIGDNGNRLIFEIWWNFRFYYLIEVYTTLLLSRQFQTPSQSRQKHKLISS